MRRQLPLIALCLAACGDAPPAPPARPAAPPPPPDAGTRRGHGADPGSVRVPRADPTPPEADVRIERLGARRGFRATATGSDDESGVARVRLSVDERRVCRSRSGRLFVRQRRRHFPPPQIERVRATAGARLPAKASRSRRLPVRCGGGATVEEARLEVWAEAHNGVGREAVSEPRRASLTAPLRP